MYRYGLLIACLMAPIHSAMADLSWYLGAGGTYTTLESKNFAQASGIQGALPDGSSITTGQFNDSPVGWQLFGGLMISENFGFALKYNDSGEAKDDWGGTVTTTLIPGPPPVTVDTDVSFAGEMSFTGITAYFVQTVPMSEKVEFTLELGYTLRDLDFNWSETSASGLIQDSGSVSTDDAGFAVGAIVRYKFVKHFAVSGEIEYSTPDFGGLIDRPWVLSLNGEFHF